MVAIEGVHGSGKTTLVHSAVGYFRAKGINATDVPESARSSPLFEAALLYDGPAIDEWAELHLLGDQIANEQLKAHNAELVISDRAVLNVASYWRVRFSHCEPITGGVFSAARKFLLEYCRSVYDVVFLLTDDYGEPSDRLRESDQHFRRAVALQIEEDLAELAALGTDVVHVPRGASHATRLRFVSDTLKGLRLLE